MTDGPDRADPRSRTAADDFSALEADLSRRAKVQRRALLAERIIRAFWPAWTVLAAVAGLALVGAFELLPRLAHVAALILGALAVLGAAGWGLRNLRLPTEAEARAALDESLPDRPVAALSDAQALGASDPASRAIWALHRRRVAARAALARPRDADLRVSSRDPYAMRLSALILLAMGLLVAGLDGGRRLAASLDPGAAPMAAAPIPPSVEAWAAPPAYTHADMIYLTEKPGETVALPAGSRLSIRVYEAPGEPQLTGEVTVPADAGAPLGEGAHDFTFVIRDSGALAVEAGGETLAAWRFETAPDAAPTIDFASDATATETRSLQFSFIAQDDYGVVSAWAEITLDRDRMKFPDGHAPEAIEPIRAELPLSFAGAETDVEETLVQDFTEHPWAGLPVLITLKAEDAAGQQSRSEPLEAVLPARFFSDAMARAFLEERRAMAGTIEDAPEALQRLKAVTAWPEDWFGDHTGPYLVARTAMRRLGYALDDGRAEREILSVLDLLWRAAVMLEEGDLSSAAERLARAQQRLQEALNRGASPEELRELMDELRQAMNEYLSEMARQALQNMDQMENQGNQQQNDGQQMDMADLQQMLDELQRLAEQGDREAAQQLLQALSQMLQNLQMQAQQGGQGQQGQGGEMMEQLQDMLRNQQELADRSFGEMQRRQGQGGQGGEGEQGEFGSQSNPYGRPNRGGLGPNGLQPPSGERPGMPGREGQAEGGSSQDMGDLAQRQEALRRMLEDLRAQLPGGLSPETDQALGEAEDSMNNAREGLAQDDPEGALDDQVQAMENLREGARQLGEALRRQAQNGQGDRAGRGSPNGQDRALDPMGRPVARDGSPDGGDTHVPSEEELARARELLDEIRRRSGERTRPELELDYLRRLLERF